MYDADNDIDDSLSPEPTIEELEIEAGNNRMIKGFLLDLLGESDGAKAAHLAEHQEKMRPSNIKTIAQLIAGTGPGWQSDFARALGLSRNHISMLLSGGRPATDDVRLMISKAADAAAKDFEERAKKLRLQASRLRF